MWVFILIKPSSHIDNVRQSVLFHIRNMWRIRKFIDTATCYHAARVLMVLTRIRQRRDYVTGVKGSPLG